jgi:hypothetical protein
MCSDSQLREVRGRSYTNTECKDGHFALLWCPLSCESHFLVRSRYMVRVHLRNRLAKKNDNLKSEVCRGPETKSIEQPRKQIRERCPTIPRY